MGQRNIDESVRGQMEAQVKGILWDPTDDRRVLSFKYVRL